MTRTLSTSLALTMLFAASTAMAVPQQTHESAFTSLKKSVATGVAEYKERRAAAGPGVFKRTMTKIGASVDRMHDKATALGEKISIKLENAGAKLDAKRDAIVDHVKVAAANTKAYGLKVVHATKMGVAATRASMAQSRAARAAYKSADKDFNAWLNEKGNEDAKTFYRGAAKDAGIASTKVVKNLNKFSVVTSTLMSATNPLWLAPAAVNAGLAHDMSKKLTADKRTIAERTINLFMDKVPAERLESWSKASYIDPELAK